MLYGTCLVLDDYQKSVIDFYPQVYYVFPFARLVLDSDYLLADNDLIYFGDTFTLSAFAENKADKILSCRA